MKPRDVFEWGVFAVLVFLSVIVLIALAITITSNAPTCPPGEDYVFTHHNLVGRVIVPQYDCQ